MQTAEAPQNEDSEVLEPNVVNNCRDRSQTHIFGVSQETHSSCLCATADLDKSQLPTPQK